MKRYLDMGIIYFLIQANCFIYYLRKISILKDIIPGYFYKLHKVKYIFGIFAIIFTLIKKIIPASSSIILLAYYLPNLIFDFFGKEVLNQDYIILFLIVNTIVPAIIQSNIFKVQKEDNMFLNHFQINPYIYYNYKITKDLMTILLILPALLFVFNMNLKLISVLLCFKIGIVILGNNIFLHIYDKKKRIPSKWYRLTLSLIISVVTCIILLLFDFKLQPMSIGFSICTNLILLIIAGIGYTKLIRYKKYLRIARQYANSDVISFKVAVSNIAPEDSIALNKSNWEDNKTYLKNNSHLSVVDYINKAFITRHKKVISQFYINRGIFIILISILIGFIYRFKSYELKLEEIFKFIPIIIFSFLSFSRQFCQMSFLHCDRHLMADGVYNHPDFLHKGFIYRLKLLLKNTTIMSLIFVVGISIVYLIIGTSVNIQTTIAFIIISVCILYFFEVYHLFVYYLLQPYTIDANIKSPIYRFVSWFEFLMSIGILFVRNDFTYYCIPVFIVTVFFIIVGYLCVKKYSIRCFKLK